MGIIRGGLLVIVCVLFFIGLLVGNLLFSVYGSLEYKDIKENLGKAIRSFAESEINTSELVANVNTEEIKIYCQNHTSYTYDSNFSDLNINVDISCQSALNGQVAIIDEFVIETVDQLYYKQYDCSFSQCLEDKKNALYFVSEYFRNYLSSKVYIMFLVLAILFVLMLLLAEHRANALIIAGVLLIVASLPFMKLESFAGSVISGNFSDFSKVFLSDAYRVFVINLVTGILLLIIGIAIKLTGVGMKISEFFSKKKEKEKEISEEKVEEIVKKEVQKAKQEEAKKTTVIQNSQKQTQSNQKQNKSGKK